MKIITKAKIKWVFHSILQVLWMIIKIISRNFLLILCAISYLRGDIIEAVLYVLLAIAFEIREGVTKICESDQAEISRLVFRMIKKEYQKYKKDSE